MVIQIGNSGCLGIGNSLTSISLAEPSRTRRGSPRQSAWICSIRWNISSRWLPNASGANTKSFGCQPEAQAMPTRPCERLSTIDHSSATRTGWCSGSTTLPARSSMCEVSRASAALNTDGLGESPPKAWKCRSGSHSEEKPRASA